MNSLYTDAKEKLLGESAQINMISDDIRLALLDLGTYTFNPANTSLTPITAAIVARTAAGLTGKTVALGTFDAADPTLPAVTGVSVEAVLIYKFVTNDAGSIPIAYIDTPAISYVPNGSDVTVIFDPAGIFSI